MDPLSDTVAASDSSELGAIRHQAGDVIGRYSLVRLLGVGGMGEVWEAKHNEIGKKAAVKFLFPQLASDPTFVERFRREAMATANIDHPKICRALDFSSSEDETYLILDFVDGEPLADRMSDGEQFAPLDVVKVGVAICEGLEAAHEVGIVHRDLKPENVMISDGDFSNLKLLDFGISAFAGKKDERLTQTGQAIGTPTYMSPEQIKSREITAQSDLYALGVLMYEMLAGRPPFTSDVPFEVLEGHMRFEPPALSDFRPECPIDLEKLVHRLLEKEPGKRPNGASQLKKLLNELDLTTTQLMTATPTKRARTPEIPKRAVIIAVAIALLVLPLVGFGVWVAFSDADPTDAVKERRAQSFNEERASALTDNETLVEAQSLFSQGSHGLAAGKVDEFVTANGPHAHALSLKAESQIAEGKIDAGLDTFADAAKHDRRYLGYAPLIQSFRKCIKARGCESLKPRGWDLSDSDAGDFVESLFNFAIDENNSGNQRRLAENALTQFGGEPELETWQKDALILVNGKSCDERRVAIQSLSDSSVPNARTLLESFAAKPKRGCGLLNLKDCIACLRGPLDDALSAQK